jgi:hypothetical protein
VCGALGLGISVTTAPMPRKVGRPRMAHLSSPTKLCPRCDEVKPRTAFHKNHSRPCGLQSYCRECQARRERTGAELDTARERGRANRKYIREQRNRPCEDCGSQSKPEKMHFHHVWPGPGDVKRLSAVGNRTRAGIDAEIAKCIVLCVPCHHERHRAFREDGFYSIGAQ